MFRPALSALAGAGRPLRRSGGERESRGAPGGGCKHPNASCDGGARPALRARPKAPIPNHPPSPLLLRLLAATFFFRRNPVGDFFLRGFDGGLFFLVVWFGRRLSQARTRDSEDARRRELLPDLPPAVRLGLGPQERCAQLLQGERLFPGRRPWAARRVVSGALALRCVRRCVTSCYTATATSNACASTSTTSCWSTSRAGCRRCPSLSPPSPSRLSSRARPPARHPASPAPATRSPSLRLPPSPRPPPLATRRRASCLFSVPPGVARGSPRGRC